MAWRANGFTLAEILIVLAALAILAVVGLGVIPDNSDQKRQAAASEVAAGLRFARSEAMRKAQPHGVRLSPADDRVRVFRLDTTGAPLEQYDVLHPVTKKLYAVALAEGVTAGMEISVSDFRFAGDPTSREAVAFAADGRPISPVDLSALTQGEVRIRLRGRVRVVTVAVGTGRVTVQ